MDLFFRQRRMVQEEIHKLREQGFPTTFQDLNQWYPVFSGSNGAGAYRAAFEALNPEDTEPDIEGMMRKMQSGLPFWFHLRQRVRDVFFRVRLFLWAMRAKYDPNYLKKWVERRHQDPSRAVVDGGKSRLPIVDSWCALPEKGPLAAEVREGMEEYLAEKAQAIELLREAMKNPNCRFEPDWSSGMNDVLACQTGVDNTVRFFCVQALLAGDDRDGASAADALCDAIAVIPTLRSIPNFMGLLVEISCMKKVLDVLEWLLNCVRFSTADLEKLAGALDRIDDPDALRRAYIGERCFGFSYSDKSEGNISASTLSKGKLVGLVHDYIFDAPETLQCLKTMQKCIDAAALPPADRWKACSAISRHIDQLPRYLLSLRSRLTVITSHFSTTGRHTVRLGLARTALAVEQFRSRTGALPARLEQLVPDFLREIPRDISGNVSVHYEPNGSAYVVWSKGVTNALGEGVCTNNVLAEKVQLEVDR